MSVRLPRRPEYEMSRLLDLYKRKLERGVLPPDPARIIELILRTLPTIEHILPIPPILEKVHSELTYPLVESLPRLPMTSDFPEVEWKRWIRERW